MVFLCFIRSLGGFCFTLRSMIHFKLILVKAVRFGSRLFVVVFFTCGYPFVLAPFVEKLSLPFLLCQRSFDYHSFDYCSFIVHLEFEYVSVQLCCSLSVLSHYSGSFASHINLRSVYRCPQITCWDFYRACIDPIDQAGKN